jgi:uncharacterized protein (TIGR02145 family)
MKPQLFLLAILMAAAISVSAQVSISTDGSSPDPSSMLDLKSTNKGALISRMTSAQRIEISSPTSGLLVYQTDAPDGLYYYDGLGWLLIKNYGNYSSYIIDADGNAYLSVNIENQSWMAENLRVTHYSNGDPISNVTDNATWSTLSIGAYCWYNNDETNFKKPYGAFYNWFAVNDTRGLCPTGWHVPSNTEYNTLINYLGGTSAAGGKMKDVNLWASPNTGASNSSGFSALPGGYRNSYGEFYNNTIEGWWWTSFVNNQSTSGRLVLFSNTAATSFGAAQKKYGASIRCIKSDIADIDGDGVIDTIDNCPFNSNPNQQDSDGDGIGDACE